MWLIASLHPSHWNCIVRCAKHGVNLGASSNITALAREPVIKLCELGSDLPKHGKLKCLYFPISPLKGEHTFPDFISFHIIGLQPSLRPMASDSLFTLSMYSGVIFPASS